MGKKRQRLSVGERQGIVVRCSYMGRNQGLWCLLTEEDAPQTKKSRHKKSKHKKRKYVEDEEEGEVEEEIGLEPQPEMSVVPVASKPLTLKIKLGSEVLTPDSKSRYVVLALFDE